MRNQRILRRLEMLERVFAVEPRDDWIDILMWNGSQGGIFGHTHCRFSESRSQTELIPCSDEEEIAIMRDHFEETEHKIPGTDTPVGFSGARGCEASKLSWTDVDEKSCTITINNPVKGSLPRVVKVTPKTIAMIKAMPKTGNFVFNPNIYTVRKDFIKQRKRIAKTLQNPRLKQIHFHTLRHWKATMEYHRTKDILHVKRLLGHKKLENTEIYTHLINFESDEWNVAYAKNLKEETKLIEAGFEYVRYSEKDELAIYRKRK